MDASRLLGRVQRQEAELAGMAGADLPPIVGNALDGNIRFLMVATWALSTPGEVDMNKLVEGSRHAQAFLDDIRRRFPKKFAAMRSRGHPMPLTAQ